MQIKRGVSNWSASSVVLLTNNFSSEKYWLSQWLVAIMILNWERTFLQRLPPRDNRTWNSFPPPVRNRSAWLLPCLPERRLCQISKTEPCTKSRKSIDEWLTEIFVTILQTQKITWSGCLHSRPFINELIRMVGSLKSRQEGNSLLVRKHFFHQFPSHET